MSRVFVYGSLRHGGALNGALSTAEFIGTTKTHPQYSLYSLGAFPALIAGGNTSVVGEVYEVTPRVLADLDRIEGHPHFYVRTPIELEDGTNAEVYLLPEEPRGCEVVASGDWIDYHGARFGK